MGEIWVTYGCIQITPKYHPNNFEVYEGLTANRRGLEIWVNMGEIWANMKSVETPSESIV